MDVIVDSQVQKKKGKLFSDEECVQIARSWLNVSEDSTVGTGQKAEMLWTRIHKHYHENISPGMERRPLRSLETKWREINHDVNKFVGYHASVEALNESGTNAEDVMEKALQMFKELHPRKQTFKYIQSWYVLRHNPKWLNYQDPVTPTPNSDTLEGNVENSEVTILTRPTGIKSAKRERAHKKVQLASQQLRASDKTMKTVAKANLIRAEAVQLQTYMSLFSADLETMQDDARRFFALQRQKILNKVETGSSSRPEIELHVEELSD